MIAVALLSMTFGLVLPKLWDLGREGGGIEQYIKTDAEAMTDLIDRVRGVEVEVSKGGRWTLENQMDYASVQQQQVTKIEIRQTEHIAQCQAAWQSTSRVLERMDQRMERIEKKLK